MTPFTSSCICGVSHIQYELHIWNRVVCSYRIAWQKKIKHRAQEWLTFSNKTSKQQKFLISPLPARCLAPIINILEPFNTYYTVFCKFFVLMLDLSLFALASHNYSDLFMKNPTIANIYFIEYTQNKPFSEPISDSVDCTPGNKI